MSCNPATDGLTPTIPLFRGARFVFPRRFRLPTGSQSLFLTPPPLALPACASARHTSTHSLPSPRLPVRSLSSALFANPIPVLNLFARCVCDKNSIFFARGAITSSACDPVLPAAVQPGHEIPSLPSAHIVWRSAARRLAESEEVGLAFCKAVEGCLTGQVLVVE